jgi:putative ATP-dependent endonuclease of OLD family
MVARLTYEFGPKEDLEGEPTKEADYEYRLYGGNNRDNRIDSGIRRRLPIVVLPALRDVEDSLASWRRSPLRPLLDAAVADIDRQHLIDLATQYHELARVLSGTPEIAELGTRISYRLEHMVGDVFAFPVHLGFAPPDPDRLIRSVRLLVDEQQRGVGEASLGSANLLFLTLKQLELDLSVQQKRHDHTFLGIEEPEAHLHPHVQRLVYKSVLQPRRHMPQAPGENEPANGVEASTTLLLTTHSPHIVSVAPVRSLVLIKKAEGASIAASTANLQLDDDEVSDLERYLDVTRGEVLFARGVILVEGEAETYLIPAFARSLGYDLDQLGITVSSVAGTHFLPYVKLLGPQGLDLPVAVITDADPMPNGSKLGYNRVRKLMREIMRLQQPRPKILDVDAPGFVASAAEFGMFLNKHTLEVDLFNEGHHIEMMEVLSDLTKVGKCRTRATKWSHEPEMMDPARLLKDIEKIGKGRFSQRLASELNPDIAPPDYIVGAFEYLAEQLQ